MKGAVEGAVDGMVDGTVEGMVEHRLGLDRGLWRQGELRRPRRGGAGEKKECIGGENGYILGS